MGNFKEQLEAKRQAAQGRSESHSKPLSEMSEEELDQEHARVQQELRAVREREVAATREAVAETGKRPRFLPNRRKKNWR